MKNHNIVVIGVLAALIGFYAIANQLWLEQGTSLYGRDVAGHLQLVTKFHYQIQDILQNNDSFFDQLTRTVFLFHEDSLPIHHTYMWPKLVHISTAVVCFIFGLSQSVMIHWNIFFFAVLIISTYLIGRYCYSEKAGLFAAVLIGLFPAIYGQSRKFGLDFPLIAMTALNIYVLLRTEKFNRRGYSVLLGITFGLGVLTKGQLILCLAGPIIYCLIYSLKRKTAYRSSISLNMLIFIIISAAISALWWWGILGGLWRAYVSTVSDYPFSWAYAYKRQPPFTTRWLFFHAVHSAISISPFFFILFLIALFSFLRSKVKDKAVFIIWLLATYAIWTISNIKRDTDFFPCLPALALITAFGISSWKHQVLRKGVILACIVIGMIQYFSLSFSSKGFNVWNVKNPYNKPREPDGYNTPFQPPYQNNYKEIMDRFSERIIDQSRSSRYVRIGIVEAPGSDRWIEYNTAILAYYFHLYNPGAFIYRSRHTPESFLEHARSFNIYLSIAALTILQPNSE